MTTDSDRNIATIRYNILNLPDTIQFSTGNQIINRYSASRWLSGGQKLGTEYFTRVTNLAVPLIRGQVIKQTYSKNVVNQNGTAYIDNKEYTTLNGNTVLTAMQHIYNSEGFADTITATIPNYKYYRRDHLGNNRELWCANTKKTLQRTQYYPSGLPWPSNTADNPGVQERKYNGKEFVEMHGLDTYDYGARGYYPAMGRFTTVDPLAEKHYSISPYAHCSGNPVNRIDPDGRDWILSIGKKIYWYSGQVGDKNTKLLATFKATSGYVGKDVNGKEWNLQKAKFQDVKGGGPTPAGNYHINLKPEPDRVAKADSKTGELKKNPDGGIEKIPSFVENPNKPGYGWSYLEWGKNRAHLEPDNVTGASNKQRDNNSYYFHDSEKGYTHGCTEVQTEFFDKLNEYRDDGNEAIEVVIKYPSAESSTNGGTKK